MLKEIGNMLNIHQSMESESVPDVSLKSGPDHVISPNSRTNQTNGLTCAVKKAGVREPDGRAGLLRAMEPMSLPASSRDGAEISRALGFLLFGGSPSPWLL